MAAEDPRDFQVRLDWPGGESGGDLSPASAPPTRKLPEPAQSVGAEERRRVGEPGLAEVMRSLDVLRARVDRIASALQPLPRAVRTIEERVQALSSEPAVSDLAKRVERLSRTVQALPTDATVSELAGRVEHVARTAQALPSEAAVAELTGRVDGLAAAVEAISLLYSTQVDRVRSAVEEASSQLNGFGGAADDVRRLTAQVSAATQTRTERQEDLNAQVEELAAALKALRSAFPAPRKARPAAAAKSTRKAVPRTRKAATKASGAAKKRRTTS